MDEMISIDGLIANPSELTSGRSYKQVLESALSIISDPNRWTTSAFARNRSNLFVRPTSPQACSWCILGAISKASNQFGIIPPELLVYLQELCVELYGDKYKSVADFNDYVDHKSALDFLHEAIRRFDL
jgi:hypothetical protein